jgi:hypothetical protein
VISGTHRVELVQGQQVLENMGDEILFSVGKHGSNGVV